MTTEIQFGHQMQPARDRALGSCWLLSVVAES